MIAEWPRSNWFWWSAVAAAALAGLGLRILAAQGGLWTDEAWSMIYATQAGNPAGVFLRINHDNNHHLYSLWLQAIGMHAPPLLARLPAILSGTASIVVAALFARRWSASAGLVAALLFAFAPALVTYGAEARGYAPMILAALGVLYLATSGTAGQPARPATPWLITAFALLGIFSQLTMVAVIALTSLWVYLDRRAASGPAAGMREAARLMGPAVLAAIGAVLFVLGAAAASPTGMRLGGYLPFAWTDYATALDDLSGWAVGASGVLHWVGPLLIAGIALALAWRPPAWLGSRGRLYGLLILGVPLAVGLLHPGNAGFARYYLTSALGLLLLAAEWIGRGLDSEGAVRAWSAAALATLLASSAWHDRALVLAERGHPDEALAQMIARSPRAARVALWPKRFEGMVTVAAAQRAYDVRFVDDCAPADFVLVSTWRSRTAVATLNRCGASFHAIASGAGTAMSGDFWTLYGASPGFDRLQTAGRAVSGRLPGGIKSRPSGRAGVAQG